MYQCKLHGKQDDYLGGNLANNLFDLSALGRLSAKFCVEKSRATSDRLGSETQPCSALVARL